ncbi:MAG: cytochrome c oxidase subunit II [Acidobacteriota bacterium]
MQSSLPLMPESASTLSSDVDALYFYLSGVTVFFTLLIAGAIIFFVIRYRRRNPSEIPRPIEGSTKLETLWSVIPLLIAMSFFFWGASVFYRQYRPPTNALEVYVVGKQWMWKFQHPTGQREINELHVPVGRKVKLIMTTEDVIHDVFVPAFRIKADVVPGKYTTQWFEATKPGRYHFFCAEYCGMNHSGMRGWVVVMEPTEFENWLSGNANQMSPAAAGQQMFESLGCASCHGANGEGGRGPSLLGLFGSNVTLTNGQTVPADEAYLRESIMNPQAKIVSGFGPIMPTFQGQMNEEQLLQVTAYIKSLSTVRTETQTSKPPPASAKPSATPAAKK